MVVVVVVVVVTGDEISKIVSVTRVILGDDDRCIGWYYMILSY